MELANAVLHRLDGVGDLDQLADGAFGVRRMGEVQATIMHGDNCLGQTSIRRL
jgi:hypothetical protein